MEMEGEVVQPPPMVNLMGHCSICLRMMTSRGDTGPTTTTPRPAKEGGEEDDKYNREGYLEEEEGPVPEGRLPAEWTSFRHIWSYLLGNGGRAEEVTRAKFVTQTWVISELPPVCHACGEKVTQLDRLHRELEAKVQEIKKVIREAAAGGGGAAPVWRRRGGLSKLPGNSELGSGAIRDTFRFLELLHGPEPDSEWPLNDEDLPSGLVELERDDWKLRAVAVVSISPLPLPITLPEMETEDDEVNQTRRGAKRRRVMTPPGSAGRKAKVPFLPQEELVEVEYHWDIILDWDIKQEEVEPVETNNENDDPDMGMLSTHVLLDPKDTDVETSPGHDNDSNPGEAGVGVKALSSPRRSQRLPRATKAPGAGGAQSPQPGTSGGVVNEGRALVDHYMQVLDAQMKAARTLTQPGSPGRPRLPLQSWPCGVNKCSLIFSNKQRYKLHLERLHGQPNDHPCTFHNCKQSFHSNSDLKVHIKTHTKKEDRDCLYKCKDCGKTFTVSGDVRKHARKSKSCTVKPPVKLRRI